MNGERPSGRRVNLRPRAVTDIERHTVYLDENAIPDVAQRFRAAIMEAIERIGATPSAGSLREVRNSRLSGLRMRIVPGFRNYLLFYLTPEGVPEIIRLLHAAQDIAGILEEEEYRGS